MKLTKDRRNVLQSLVRGDKVTGRLANDIYPAVAKIKRGRMTYKVKPSVIDALYRGDLIDKQWEGLGNWTAIITEAGRRALATEDSTNE